MQDPWTRLIHIPTGRLEPTALEDPSQSTPAYIALSHVWSEGLFPVDLPFLASAGAAALQAVLQHPVYADRGIDHCWADTCCIDQADEADKQRQIPLMGNIYGGAEVVAIITRDSFAGLSQDYIDRVAADVEGAVAMAAQDTWTTEGKRWAGDEAYRARLKRAMDVLEWFTRPGWGSRVWTLQEYILARETVWIGSDLQPLRIEARLFQAVPDVCDYLSIEECLLPKYKKLYGQFIGMAGAHLRLIEATRVMELLGGRQATVPEDEVYGLMAASGVVLRSLDVKGKEKVWALWWEEALRQGHFRWALLPPVLCVLGKDEVRNCMMPPFAGRHLASTNSVLDAVRPYGEVAVIEGTVSMVGRLAGRCDIVQKLGKVYLDEEDHVVRDVTLILFASNSWHAALLIAAAFGAGRYTFRQRVAISQVLLFNYFRAKLAVLSQKTSSFRPRFRSERQKATWSDFMLLQSSHARVMSDSVAFLARLTNRLKSTEIIVVSDGQPLTGRYWAVDFGAVNDSGKTMLTIQTPSVASSDEDTSASFHRAGVSMYVQLTDDAQEAERYASHIMDETDVLERFNLGGSTCIPCRQRRDDVGAGDSILAETYKGLIGPEKKKNLRALMFQSRLHMRKQNKSLQKRWKKQRLRINVGQLEA